MGEPATPPATPPAIPPVVPPVVPPAGALPADPGITAAEAKSLREQIASFTAADAQRKIDAEAARVKKAEEAGEHQKLYEAEKTARAAADERIAKYEAADLARTEKLAKSNAAALKKLPANLRALVTADMSPEAAAGQIARLQGLTGANDNRPGGGINPQNPNPGAPVHPPEFLTYAAKCKRKPGPALFKGWQKHHQNKGA